MKVWIDQDLCTGDGICAEICPSVFQMHDDGLAYVKEAEWQSIAGPDASKGEPLLRMASGLAVVPEGDLDAVIESAEECPGECIFIEVG
jgi:ferredoxin